MRERLLPLVYDIRHRREDVAKALAGYARAMRLFIISQSMHGTEVAANSLGLRANDGCNRGRKGLARRDRSVIRSVVMSGGERRVESGSCALEVARHALPKALVGYPRPRLDTLDEPLQSGSRIPRQCPRLAPEPFELHFAVAAIVGRARDLAETSASLPGC